MDSRNARPMDESNNICHCYFRELVYRKTSQGYCELPDRKKPQQPRDLRSHKDDITSRGIKNLVLRASGQSDHML
jgi:hypothetical protein